MTAFNICYKLYEFCFENNGPSVQSFKIVEIQKIWKKLCTNVCPTGAFITDAGTRNIYYGLRCLFLLLLFSISLFFGLEISIKSKSITVFLKWKK